MKNITFSFFMVSMALMACNSGNQNTTSSNNKDTVPAIQPSENTTAAAVSEADPKNTVSLQALVSNYLQLKNALIKDNTREAATAGTLLETAFKSFDKSALTAIQKKAFEDVEDDAREHAEHIGKNGGNIAHQREHFAMLSKDIVDLIKTFGNGGLTLYKFFCPMYNNGKGAYWISETKDIENPYFGKAMPTCGTMKEIL